MTRAVQHSAKSVEHYTPPEYIEAARTVMGGIDLDPASCELANRHIRAERYYTKADDGIARPWHGCVWVNPPGGPETYKGRKVNSQALWWARTTLAYDCAEITCATFLVFNLELFRHAQQFDVRHPLDYEQCYPSVRIPFLKPNADGSGVVVQKQPGHPNALIYLGPHCKAFYEAFHGFGKIVTPMNMLFHK